MKLHKTTRIDTSSVDIVTKTIKRAQKNPTPEQLAEIEKDVAALPPEDQKNFEPYIAELKSALSGASLTVPSSSSIEDAREMAKYAANSALRGVPGWSLPNYPQGLVARHRTGIFHNEKIAVSSQPVGAASGYGSYAEALEAAQLHTEGADRAGVVVVQNRGSAQADDLDKYDGRFFLVEVSVYHGALNYSPCHFEGKDMSSLKFEANYDMQRVNGLDNAEQDEYAIRALVDGNTVVERSPENTRGIPLIAQARDQYVEHKIKEMDANPDKFFRSTEGNGGDDMRLSSATGGGIAAFLGFRNS